MDRWSSSRSRCRLSTCLPSSVTRDAASSTIRATCAWAPAGEGESPARAGRGSTGAAGSGLWAPGAVGRDTPTGRGGCPDGACVGAIGGAGDAGAGRGWSGGAATEATGGAGGATASGGWDTIASSRCSSRSFRSMSARLDWTSWRSVMARPSAPGSRSLCGVGKTAMQLRSRRLGSYSPRAADHPRHRLTSQISVAAVPSVKPRCGAPFAHLCRGRCRRFARGPLRR